MHNSQLSKPTTLLIIFVIVLAAAGLAVAGLPAPETAQAAAGPGGPVLEALPPPGSAHLQATVGYTFTYQGRLEQETGPVEGSCDLTFRLFDSFSGGSQVGSDVSNSSVVVQDGYFTQPLNFGGGMFDGSARWLEITINSCNGDSGSGGPLSPRVALSAAPYALYALDGPWGSSGWSLTGNSGTTDTSFLGTTDNMTLTLKVNNRTALRLIPGGNAGGATPNIIGGGAGNSISPTIRGGVIGGGGGNEITANFAAVSGGQDNQATERYATVGGGYKNQATELYATVSGGHYNQATGTDATVGGGWDNQATAYFATVGGGHYNQATEESATVGGGHYNQATGTDATVGGGASNVVSGGGATVPGGQEAKADHYGQWAYASGQFSEPGDAQTSAYVWRNTTYNANITELLLDGASERLTIADGQVVTFAILVAAKSSTGDAAGYQLAGVIENSGGTTAFVGTPTNNTLGADAGAGGWTVNVQANDTNDALIIRVTGAAGTEIRWVASARTTEVAF